MPAVMEESTDVVLRPENPAAELNINMAAPDRAARSLATLAVECEVTVPSSVRTFRFPSLAADPVGRDMDLQDPAGKAVSQIIAEFPLTRRRLLRRAVRDEDNTLVAGRQHLQRPSEGVEPAREQQDLVGGKRRALRIEVEEGLLGFVRSAGGKAEADDVVGEERDRVRQRGHHLRSAPERRIAHGDAEVELPVPFLAHVPARRAAARHTAVGCEDLRGNVEQVLQAWLDRPDERRRDPVSAQSERGI